jgi:hypothetical protein
MATKQDKQLLIDTLKFTPRTYTIQMWGYGGERVMGTVDRAAWDYCVANQIDLQDIAWNSDAAEEMELDEDLLPFPPGSWYECDNMAHVSGVSRSAGTLQIADEHSETIFEKSLDDIVGGGCDGEPDWCCNDEVWVGSRKAGEIVFVGVSNEKGTFFEGEIPLRAPFNIELLELHYDEVDGEEIVNCVYYDGEEVENNGGSTNGKSSDFTMCLLTDDRGNWTRYDPGEKDWGTPECGSSPNDWEKSPEFKFKKIKPVYVGWYKCVWSSWGTTYGSAYWDGEQFVEFEYGKSKPITGVETWQGYNWDTADWANRPSEPPDLSCDNKSCGWVGHGKDRVEDADYNSHCPGCEGTEFTWIDYDPDTKLGLANRAKYCQPATPKEWDPVAELDKIIDEFDHLTVNVTPWIPAQIKPNAPGVYECQFKKAPAWPWPPVESLTWNGKKWINDDGDTVTGVKEWRELEEETA